MSDRDQWWSTFLHRQWGTNEDVDRLVEWSWTKREGSDLDDETARLAGITLTWFFTAPNRFLRDRATKAMVQLFDKRIPVLLRVMDAVLEADDLYLHERLYAVAYGCTMRSEDAGAITELAQHVYNEVFKSGEVVPHVLLRDYARGVIEIALERGADLRVNFHKVRPPYQSQWLSSSVPNKEDLEEKWRVSDDAPDWHWSKRHLYSSVMGDGMGDFSQYVIGGLDEWSSQVIGEPSKPTHEHLVDKFVESLTDRQANAWKSYEAAEQALSAQEMYAGLGSNLPQAARPLPVDLIAAKRETEHAFAKTLRKKSSKFRLYEQIVVPYLANPYQFRREDRFDGSLARRWIMGEVDRLGWTVERFGRFDHSVSLNRGREARKPERIGKKYQWLAYHELLARMADNFYMHQDGISTKYQGPWGLSRGREIDPSNVLKKASQDDWRPHRHAWWFTPRHDDWGTPADEVDWLERDDPLPLPEEIIEIQNPNDGANWMTLDGFYLWEEPVAPGETRYGTKRREVFYMVKSYLCRSADVADLKTWSRDQWWPGRWMPESSESYNIFLGELYWAPAIKELEMEYIGHSSWTRGHNDEIPREVMLTNDEYGQSDSGFDCSVDESMFITVPSKVLVEGMKLGWRGVEGEWFDQAGQLIALDPSVRSIGPRALVVRKTSLLDYLESSGLSMFWTLLGEKQILGGTLEPADYVGRLEISGTFWLDSDTISGRVKTRFTQ